MDRLALYKEILSYILTNFSGLDPATDDYKDVSDYIDADDPIEAANLLLPQPTLPSVYHPWLKSVIEYSSPASLSKEIAPRYDRTVLLAKLNKNQKYRRKFYYCDRNLFVVDTERFFRQISTLPYPPNLWMGIEQLCLVQSSRERVLDMLQNNGTPDTYCMAYNKGNLGYLKNARVINDELYSYGFAASIQNKDAIEVHPRLLVDLPKLKLSAFSYNKNVVYQQYYDIYDALNDWLLSKDILTAFLNLYQVAEFLIYRYQMSQIVKVSTVKQSFLREIKTMNKSFETGERKAITTTIPKLFPNLTATAPHIKKAEAFIKKYYESNSVGARAYLNDTLTGANLQNAFAKFIYDTRCAIVHNKEAEFHISYNNYDAYKSIIPLMKDIHNSLADKIWLLINDPTADVSYVPHRYIDLY